MASSDPWVGVYDRVPAPMPRRGPPPAPPPAEELDAIIIHEVGSPPRVAGWRLGFAAIFFWLARRFAGLP